MASKFLDLAAPVAAALKVGTPIVAIETGFFMRLPYPKNYTALQECEQAFWRRDCVPWARGYSPPGPISCCAALTGPWGASWKN